MKKVIVLIMVVGIIMLAIGCSKNDMKEVGTAVMENTEVGKNIKNNVQQKITDATKKMNLKLTKKESQKIMEDLSKDLSIENIKRTILSVVIKNKLKENNITLSDDKVNNLVDDALNMQKADNATMNEIIAKIITQQQ